MEASESGTPTPSARLTIVEVAYHHPGDGDPISVECRYSRNLQSTEQLYVRRLSIGTEWTLMDKGWIDDIGLLVIVNEEPPTNTEHFLEMTVGCLQQGIGLTQWKIPPGESFRGMPDSDRPIYLRARTNKVKCRIHVFPA